MGRARISPALGLNRPRGRAGLRLLAGLLLGAAACGWAVNGVDWAEVSAGLTGASTGWLAVGLAGVVAVALAKAGRWRDLYPRPRPAFWPTFGVLVTAQMINLLIPVRTGELLRLGLMRGHGQPVAATLPTLLIEKVIDLLAAGLLAAGLAGLTLTPGWLGPAGASALLLAAGLATGLALLGRLQQRLVPWLARWDWLANAAERGLAALALLANGRALARLLLWSGLIWLLSLLTMAALLAAFHLQLPLTAAALLMLLVSLSNIAPSPPALVGLMQGAAVLALAPFGVAQATALGVGVALNVVTVLPLILIGGWAVLNGGLRRGGWAATP